jgi:hypothetical protein
MKAAIVSELKHQAVLLRKKAAKASARKDINGALAYRDAARSLIGRAKRVRKASW